MKRITIKDLARMLNLSTSTVSRALSDHPDISIATKKRVKSTALQFNYAANFHARSFRKQNSGLIALILPEINAFFTPNLIQGINKIIDTSKFSLITFLTNDDYEKEQEMIQQCLHWAVEGALVSLSKETDNLKHLEVLKAANINCVLLDKVLGNDLFPSVRIDSCEAAFKGVSNLIKNGHQSILGIFGNPNFSITKERIKGYKKAMNESNIPISESNIIAVEKSSNLDSILPLVLKHNKRITAIFAMSDELLVKVLYYVNQFQLHVPNDLSIVSISDGVYPYLRFPTITHIKDSGFEMGKSACKILLDSIADIDNSKEKGMLITTELIELDSVSDIKNNS